jgi:hypothetical protein
MQVNSTRKGLLAGALAGAVIAGGAVGATAFGASSSNSNSILGASSAAPSGTFKPIETKSHEANESAQREAQEDAGQFPTVP